MVAGVDLNSVIELHNNVEQAVELLSATVLGTCPADAAHKQGIAGENGVAAEMSERLATSIRSVIADAIKAGGSSLKDYRQADGELGYFQHSFSVYDREGSPCPRAGCGGTVSRIVQSGRSTFYCPVCQQ